MKLLSKIYIAALIFIPIIPRINVADVVAVHWVGLSLVTIFGFFIILKSKVDFQFTKIKAPLLFFSGYLIVALISIFFAINYVESIITVTKIFLVFSNLYIIFYLLKSQDSHKLKHFTLIVILIYFTVELLHIAIPLFFLTDVFNHQFENSLIFMKGLAGNKNVAAVSIATKLPFVLYFALTSNKIIFRSISFILFFLGTLMIVYSGTRTAYLIILVLFAYTLYELVKVINSSFSFKKLIFRLLAPSMIIFSFMIYSNFSSEEGRSSIQNRVEFLNPNKIDNSGKQRLRFYKQALEYSSENIFMGAGVGNWKIISTYLDRENIVSYVMPYNLHNDFLEVLGETGIFGFIFYSGFFLSLFYLIYLIYNNKRFEDKKFAIILAICLLSYTIDAMLNFPQFRVINQLNLIIIYFFVVCSYYSVNTNKL